MKCKYEVISDSTGGVCYGIAVYSADGGIVAEVRDISTNGAAVADLVDKCNNLELSLLHLYDVIDDFLG